ncbi:MAG: hypothetical protein CM1200mP2_36970 [Planctomycetaceae bacterium]|nr:MAG: hypothetical protein CM1200mP2_36970 [Planctomycetaceae bacterium]
MAQNWMPGLTRLNRCGTSSRNLHSRNPLRFIASPYQSRPPAFFTRWGKRVASSGYHEILVWEVSTGRLVRRITNVGQRVFDIDFHPSGQSLIVALGGPAITEN